MAVATWELSAAEPLPAVGTCTKHDSWAALVGRWLGKMGSPSANVVALLIRLAASVYCISPAPPTFCNTWLPADPTAKEEKGKTCFSSGLILFGC